MNWPGPMTCVQYRAWLVWWKKELTQPTLTDQLLMQIACEVFKAPMRVWGEEPEVTAKDFRLVFGEKDGEEGDSENSKSDTNSARKQPTKRERTPEEMQEIAFNAKMRHLSFLGGNVKRRIRYPDGHVEDVKDDA